MPVCRVEAKPFSLFLLHMQDALFPPVQQWSLQFVTRFVELAPSCFASAPRPSAPRLYSPPAVCHMRRGRREQAQANLQSGIGVSADRRHAHERRRVPRSKRVAGGPRSCFGALPEELGV
jgi:hypothetical protein